MCVCVRECVCVCMCACVCVCPKARSQYVASHLDQAVPYLSSVQSVPTVTNTVTLLLSTHKSSCSVPFLSPIGTHSYQQSHCSLQTQNSAQLPLATVHLPSPYPFHLPLLYQTFILTVRKERLGTALEPS